MIVACAEYRYEAPAAVARKVEGLNKLLEAREQLSNLITYMTSVMKAAGVEPE